jgi:hypothetical protein
MPSFSTSMAIVMTSSTPLGSVVRGAAERRAVLALLSPSPNPSLVSGVVPKPPAPPGPAYASVAPQDEAASLAAGGVLTYPLPTMLAVFPAAVVENSLVVLMAGAGGGGAPTPLVCPCPLCISGLAHGSLSPNPKLGFLPPLFCEGELCAPWPVCCC